MLSDARKTADGWTPTKDGKWKIKQPLEYALRRVALDEGVTASVLRRRLKEWRDVGHRALVDLIEKERAVLSGINL